MDHDLGTPASGLKKITSYRQNVVLTQTIKLGHSSKNDVFKLVSTLASQS